MYQVWLSIIAEYNEGDYVTDITDVESLIASAIVSFDQGILVEA